LTKSPQFGIQNAVGGMGFVRSFGPLDERQLALFQVERITWEKDKSGR
jgi:hypothetical protein